MHKLTTKLSLALCGLALALPLTLNAAPPLSPPELKPGFFPPPPFELFDAEHLPPHLKELNLSDGQRAQIAELFKSQGASMRGKLEAGRKIHEEMMRLSLSTDYTEDKAKALAGSAAQIVGEGALAHAKLDQAIYQLLNPAQQQQLQEWLARPEHCHFK
jgi:Spy/CpxP family protein refolding chaperone